MNGRSSRPSPYPEIFAARIPPHHLKEPDGRSGRRVTDPFMSGAQAWQPRARTRGLARCNCMVCMEDRGTGRPCQRPGGRLVAAPLARHRYTTPAGPRFASPAWTGGRMPQRPSCRGDEPGTARTMDCEFRTKLIQPAVAAGALPPVQHARVEFGRPVPGDAQRLPRRPGGVPGLRRGTASSGDPVQPPNPRVASTDLRYASTCAAACGADQPMPSCAAISLATRSATASPPSIAS